MLESIREYGLVALTPDPEAEGFAADTLISSATCSSEPSPGSRVISKRSSSAPRRDEAKVDAALTWSLESRHAVLGLEIAAAAAHFWMYRGHLRKARDWLEQALALDVDVPPALQAKALHRLASFGSAAKRPRLHTTKRARVDGHRATHRRHPRRRPNTERCGTGR